MVSMMSYRTAWVQQTFLSSSCEEPNIVRETYIWRHSFEQLHQSLYALLLCLYKYTLLCFISIYNSSREEINQLSHVSWNVQCLQWDDSDGEMPCTSGCSMSRLCLLRFFPWACIAGFHPSVDDISVTLASVGPYGSLIAWGLCQNNADNN